MRIGALHQGPDPGQQTRLVSGLTLHDSVQRVVRSPGPCRPLNHRSKWSSGPCESTPKVRQLPKDLTQGYGPPGTEEPSFRGAVQSFNHVNYGGALQEPADADP
jgi:hypothetical protein